jgi:hypothetical protein
MCVIKEEIGSQKYRRNVRFDFTFSFILQPNLAKSSLMDYWHLSNITKLKGKKKTNKQTNIGLECGKNVIKLKPKCV